MDEMIIEHWQDPQEPGGRGVKLSGSMTIAQAAQLKEELLAALEGAGTLRIDLEGLTEIDLTGLQLLGAAHLSARARGVGFAIRAQGNQSYLNAIAAAGCCRQSDCDGDNKQSCIWNGGEC